jgi:hypothetical protein
MTLFSRILLEGQGPAYDWFILHEGNSIKTIRGFFHDFLEIFGDDHDEIYNELVDDFMEKWKRKNVPYIKKISLDIMIDSPPYSIEELKKIIMNMQPPHE